MAYVIFRPCGCGMVITIECSLSCSSEVFGHEMSEMLR